MLPTTVELLRDILREAAFLHTHAEFPALEWRKMAGMRDRLIHALPLPTSALAGWTTTALLRQAVQGSNLIERLLAAPR